MSRTKDELTNQELGQEYYGRLDAIAQDLSASIQKLKGGGTAPEVIDQATVELSKLRKNFTDAVPYLPSYDQRTLDLKIKSIESGLEGARTARAPKAKFAFKRKAAKPAASSPVSSPPPSTALSTSVIPTNKPPTSGLSISGHSHKYLSLASLALPWSSASDLTISDLDHCIVNLIPSSANPDYPQELAFTALHAKNLNNTILVLPIITGSALLHDMKNCVIALGSRQFRIHASSQVDVYITISSNPIIEHCSATRFTAYPAVLRCPTPMPVLTQTDSVRPEAQGGNSYLAVQDFSHIRATPSPNWSALAQAASILDGKWPLSAVGDVDEVLQDLLPSW
ncbi:tubulin binding cofactor C-domain-containing protein [Ganoderma leucocontextum]|nr:tubulin binding cofactor C-domain-containing protein [Ganoderma leucocontextum]